MITYFFARKISIFFGGDADAWIKATNGPSKGCIKGSVLPSKLHICFARLTNVTL